MKSLRNFRSLKRDSKSSGGDPVSVRARPTELQYIKKEFLVCCYLCSLIRGTMLCGVLSNATTGQVAGYGRACQEDLEPLEDATRAQEQNLELDCPVCAAISHCVVFDKCVFLRDVREGVYAPICGASLLGVSSRPSREKASGMHARVRLLIQIMDQDRVSVANKIRNNRVHKNGVLQWSENCSLR